MWYYGVLQWLQWKTVQVYECKVTDFSIEFRCIYLKKCINEQKEHNIYQLSILLTVKNVTLLNSDSLHLCSVKHLHFYLFLYIYDILYTVQILFFLTVTLNHFTQVTSAARPYQFVCGELGTRLLLVSILFVFTENLVLWSECLIWCPVHIGYLFKYISWRGICWNRSSVLTFNKLTVFWKFESCLRWYAKWRLNLTNVLVTWCNVAR